MSEFLNQPPQYRMRIRDEHLLKSFVLLASQCGFWCLIRWLQVNEGHEELDVADTMEDRNCHKSMIAHWYQYLQVGAGLGCVLYIILTWLPKSGNLNHLIKNQNSREGIL
jgi:hypothetical protein